VAVNPNTNLIYVANCGAVDVIDGATNSVVGTTAQVFGYFWDLAVNPSTNRIYVGSGSVWVVDGDSNTVVATVLVGASGMAVNPSTNRIYVTNGFTNGSVSVIDGALGSPTVNTVVATVPVGTNPRGVAVNPNTDRIYVTNQGDGTVSVIQDPYTPAGINVIVPLNGGLGSIGGMQTTFSSVTQSGDTSVDLLSSGPLPPTGYHVLGVAGQPAYYDITTTATFSGLVTVCIAYDPTYLIIPESKLKLLHYVNGGFAPITTSVDTVNHVICGNTTSLSPFIVAQPVAVVGGIAEAPDVAGTIPEASASDRSRVPIPAEVAAALAAGVVALGVGGWYVRRRRAR
jgi:YVTN family beta-propeller protein